MLFLLFPLQDVAQKRLLNFGRAVWRPAKRRLLPTDFFDVLLEVFDASLNVVSHADGIARRDPT